jgi:hypothetical protein
LLEAVLVVLDIMVAAVALVDCCQALQQLH